MYRELLDEFEALARIENSVEPLMQKMSERLHEQFARYNWVGFYLMADSVPPELVLGPFVGSFTPVERIPLDKGLCGAAATSKSTVVVNDAQADPRYIGGDMVKSNMVVPILVKDHVVAELDIESYFAGTFTAEDQEFLESCAALVGRYMAGQR